MKRKITSMGHYQFIEVLDLYYCKSIGQPSIQKQKISSKMTEIIRFDRKNHLMTLALKQNYANKAKVEHHLFVKNVT